MRTYVWTPEGMRQVDGPEPGEFVRLDEECWALQLIQRWYDLTESKDQTAAVHSQRVEVEREMRALARGRA